MACPYCQAAINEEDRNSLVCPVCLARAPHGARHCPGCAAELTPQALTPLPADKDCPRCGGALRIRHLGVAGVIECSDCEGLWLSADEFETVCAVAREHPNALHFHREEKAPPEKLPPGSRAYVACLSCGELMFRRQVRWGSTTAGVIVDACSNHGLWLDRDELEQVVRFLAKTQRGGAQASGVSDLFRGPPPVPKTPGLPSIPDRPQRPDRNPVLDALAFLIEIFLD